MPSLGRDAAIRGAEAEHVVVCRRIAQRASVIAAIGYRHHAKSETYSRASAAAARGLRLVIGVQSGAVDRIVGLRPQAEFRSIGLADDDAPSRAHPLNDDRIRSGHEILED